jgi:hypothetical protein
MSRMTRTPSLVRFALAAGLLAPSLPGCISYALDRLPPAGELPAPIDPPHRPSVSYTVRSSTGSDYQFSFGNHSDGNHSEWGLRDASNEFGNALSLSGQFRSVEPTTPESKADLQLDAVLVVDANDVIMVASACLLFVIPTWRTVTFDLVVEARAADGRWKRYELTDQARDINWLPFILGMSFAPWGGAYAGVRDNLYSTLLQRLHEDGFLAPVSASPPASASSSG